MKRFSDVYKKVEVTDEEYGARGMVVEDILKVVREAEPFIATAVRMLALAMEDELGIDPKPSMLADVMKQAAGAIACSQTAVDSYRQLVRDTAGIQPKDVITKDRYGKSFAEAVDAVVNSTQTRIEHGEPGIITLDSLPAYPLFERKKEEEGEAEEGENSLPINRVAPYLDEHGIAREIHAKDLGEIAVGMPLWLWCNGMRERKGKVFVAVHDRFLANEKAYPVTKEHIPKMEDPATIGALTEYIRILCPHPSRAHLSWDVRPGAKGVLSVAVVDPTNRETFKGVPPAYSEGHALLIAMQHLIDTNNIRELMDRVIRKDRPGIRFLPLGCDRTLRRRVMSYLKEQEREQKLQKNGEAST